MMIELKRKRKSEVVGKGNGKGKNKIGEATYVQTLSLVIVIWTLAAMRGWQQNIIIIVGLRWR